MAVSNSTFHDNGAGNGGGAIYQDSDFLGSARFLTITDNVATFGGGIYNENEGAGSLTIGSSIITGNSNGNCDGRIASSGYNLNADSSCVYSNIAPGDFLVDSMALSPLGDHGGPTPSRPPLPPVNAAIDNIPPGSCTASVDQRGATRPAGVGCDSGAVEVGGSFADLFSDGFESMP
jgi:predicted outer membrane repeat protein